MVLGIIDALIEMSNDIFSQFLSLPEILTQPVFPHVYVEYVFLALFFLTFILSRFIGFAKTFFMLVALALVGFFVGGVYFAAIMLMAQIPLMIGIRFVKKPEGGFGGGKENLGGLGEEPDFGKESKEPELGGLDKGPSFGKESGEPELPDMGDLGLPKEEAGPRPSGEIKPGAQVQPVQPQQPQQKICPYCTRPLTYISQYGRYYCYTCQRYV